LCLYAKQNRNCRSGSSDRLGRLPGHEAITGGYGSQGVTGVVTMAVGMSKSGPMGVRVLVSGTGMSAVLGTRQITRGVSGRH
jgi:hypothetical protein